MSSVTPALGPGRSRDGGAPPSRRSASCRPPLPLALDEVPLGSGQVGGRECSPARTLGFSKSSHAAPGEAATSDKQRIMFQGKNVPCPPLPHQGGPESSQRPGAQAGKVPAPPAPLPGPAWSHPCNPSPRPFPPIGHPEACALWSPRPSRFGVLLVWVFLLILFSRSNRTRH